MRPYLDAISDQERAALRARAVRREFARGAALFHERQIADRVLILLEGRVKLATFTADGKEMLLAVRGPGDLVGELAIVDGGARSATAIALEPVRALALAADDFTAFLREHPSANLAVTRMLADRLRDADRRRVEFLAQDTTGRVAARLIELADAYGVPDGDGVRIDLPISQEELAGWIGASREAVAKALATLRRLGWIETRRRSLTVVDRAALVQRSM